ncbi:MAG: 16S rRNA (guanine(527)-N(7))-methyltransferase RsmG [Betaproteobacteria bacterium]|nr:16S rRNA (guanine(527)-N(7))-methyltransferase RsmG [Betaproteobacteria bacterium]
MNHPQAAALRQGLGRLELTLSDSQQSQLLAYLDLLLKWNKVYNLTAFREPNQVLTHHVLDCLAVIRPMTMRLPDLRNVLDVGAGGGLPAVVIALTCPQIQVTAVDSVAKKAAFIQSVAHTLGLVNLQGVHDRVEDVCGPFELVTSRAFACLADFTAWSHQALAAQGTWMAMKGRTPHDEIAALPASIRVEGVQVLQVPGLDAQRCVVWLRPKP